MRLTELEPEWLLYSGARDPLTFDHTDSIEKANGIIFICPKCFQENNRVRSGVHSVICWCPGVPVGIGLTDPGRWSWKGTGFEDLTLVAGSSSVQLLGGCNAHFFITNGEIVGA